VTVVAVVLAVLLAASLTAVALLVASTGRTKRQLDESSRHLVDSGQRLELAEQASTKLAVASTELAAVRQDLTRSEARADDLYTELAGLRAEASSAPHIPSWLSGRVESLWKLAQMEQASVLRAFGPTAEGDGDGDAIAAGSALAGSALAGGALAGGAVAGAAVVAWLDAEVQRIRAETGTPGAISSGPLPEISPADALVLTRATQALLALLTRHTQAFNLALGADGDRMEAVVACEGWEGPDRAADDIGRLAEALGPAEVGLDLGTDEQGRLVARLEAPRRSGSGPLRA
jgi:hypothetical protein